MKKLISVCMALTLLLACISLPASAVGDATFAVGTAQARPGQTVEIPVQIENNPGIVALNVSIAFDTNVLTLQGAQSVLLFTDGAGNSVGTFTLGGSYDTAVYNIIWENGAGHANSTDNGTFAVLTFLINEDAPEGDSLVSISYTSSSVFDVDLTDVAFETRAGAVTVQAAEQGSWNFAEGTTLMTYEGESGINFVIGVDIMNDPSVLCYVETTGGWWADIELNESQTESTGAKLLIYDENDDVVEEYYVVVFGDINGDCVFDGMDISLLADAIGFAVEEPWGSYGSLEDFPESFSADVNHDYVLDGMDIAAIADQIGFIEDIEQIL